MDKRQEYFLDGAAPPVSHYTHAVRWNDILFASGMTSSAPDGSVLHPGDVVAQAREVMTGLKMVAEAAGTSLENVLKVTVWVRDARDRAAINEVRKEFFGSARPASTLVEISSLYDPDLLVEIDAVFGIP